MYLVRYLARLQALVVVAVSLVVSAIGMIAVALPDYDRSSVLLVLACVATGGGLLLALTDRWIGRSLDVVVRSGSELRQSAAERAADLARLNTELRRRDRDRAELFATMSHELRTPLNAIIGQSRLLLDGLDGDLNDEQRMDVQQIHNGGQGLLRIVNGTLDLVRLEAGRSAVEREPVQVWTVAEEVVALLRPLASAQGLDLASTISPSLPPALADEERLRQVLVNLVGNALKFTPAGSVRVEATHSDGSVIVSVVDTGIGIADADFDLIFRPFCQVDRGAARRFEGTGLGLAITQRLVELMGGHISVESATGRGSRFSVTLARATDAPPVEDTPPAGRGGRRDGVAHRTVECADDVAIVTDDPRGADLVTALQSLGVRARRLPSEDWEPALQSAPPPALLVDVLLPQAGAWTVLERACAADWASGLRIGLVGFADDTGACVINLLTVPGLAVTSIEAVGRRLSLVANDPQCEEPSLPVLVVSGDPEWRRRITMLAQSVGLGVRESAHGDAALAAVRRGLFGAVVIDLTVSRLGVVELLAELHAALGRRTCPMVVVTPAALSPRELRDLHLGACSWLAAAPSSLSAIAPDIAGWLRARERVLQPAGRG